VRMMAVAVKAADPQSSERRVMERSCIVCFFLDFGRIGEGRLRPTPPR
jgi:hypothetical protein